MIKKIIRFLFGNSNTRRRYKVKNPEIYRQNKKIHNNVCDKTRSSIEFITESEPEEKTAISTKVPDINGKQTGKDIYLKDITMVVYKKVALTFLLLEDNIELNQSSKSIKSILSKMISNHKDRVIYPIKYGNEIEEFDIIKDGTNNQEFIEKFTSFSNISEDLDMASAICCISNFIEDTSSTGMVEIENEKFKVDSMNIVAIGTGNINKDKILKEYISEQLLQLEKKYSITTKYLCIKDIQSISIASVGFNLIGHIDTNFYN